MAALSQSVVVAFLKYLANCLLASGHSFKKTSLYVFIQNKYSPW